MDEDDWVDVGPNKEIEILPWTCGDTFAEGRKFLNMTYSELWETIQNLHVANGGLHLDVHGRPFGTKAEDMLPGKIKFYCPHIRDHKDQKGRKPLKNPEAARAHREAEEKRVFFKQSDPCQFHFFVRRDVASEVPEYVEGTTKLGHKQYMLNPTKCDWYIDSEEEQKKDHRHRTRAVLVHKGHPRNILPVGKITPEIMATIESMAKHQVTVASIASAILEKYGCTIPDSSLYYAIKGLGYAIDSLGNQVLVKKTFKSHTEALLHSLRCCRDVSYAVLFENVEKSTENEVVYETWNRDFVIADSDNVAESLLSTYTVLGGDDLLKEKKMSKDINTENINGRTYDTSRIMDIGGHKKFFIGIIWTQRDELRMFEAFPEVLIMDEH